MESHAQAPPTPVRQISSIARQVDGTRIELMCPLCENWTDAGLGYRNLQMVGTHADALNPIVKCMVKSCGHVFSPKWLAQEAT